MVKDCDKLGIKDLGNRNIRDINGRLHVRLLKECQKRNIAVVKPNYIKMRKALIPTGLLN